MASPSELDSARLRRDLSLALRRRLTIYAAVGATALTVVFSLIAATTAPGKTKPAADPRAPDPTATSGPPFSAPVVLPTTAPVATQPPLARPTHAPRPVVENTPPPVVSGGS